MRKLTPRISINGRDVDFLDGNSKNRSMDNMRLLCPNCYLSNNGMFHNSKIFCK